MSREVHARRMAIVELATSTDLASVKELAQRFQVTESTIRRDLAILETDGHLSRTYGGARALVTHPDVSITQRLGEAHQQKRAIARWAAAQVQPGETVLVDGGTTTGALARELRQFDQLTVVTSGLSILQDLSIARGITVECLGGTLRSMSQTFLGPAAEAALERRSFDRVFLGADAVTAQDGICEAEPRQTRLKELMARRGDHVYVLVHAAKLGQRPFHAWAPLPPKWTLVTDTAAKDAQLQPFRDHGVQVAIAQDAPTTAAHEAQADGRWESRA